MDYPVLSQTLVDQQSAQSIVAQTVQLNQRMIDTLWANFQDGYINFWNPNTPVGVMTQLYEQMLAISTTYTSLSGASTQTNNWIAVFQEAQDVLAIIQAKSPAKLQNLPKFTDGSMMYVTPGWVLDPTTFAPLSAKTVSPPS